MLCMKLISTTKQTIFGDAPLWQQFSPNVGLSTNAQISEWLWKWTSSILIHESTYSPVLRWLPPFTPFPAYPNRFIAMLVCPVSTAFTVCCQPANTNSCICLSVCLSVCLIVSLLRAAECASLLSTHNYISQLQCKLHSNLEPEREREKKMRLDQQCNVSQFKCIETEIRKYEKANNLYFMRLPNW